MGKVISLIHLKGGVGKSTVSVHLAAWLRREGRTVLFIDADPQGSSSQWMAEAEPEIPVFPYTTRQEVLNHIDDLTARSDYVIIDGPARLGEVSLICLAITDVLLILCNPSALDIRASQHVIEELHQARRVRRDPQGKPYALFIPNRVQLRTNLSKDLLDAANAIGVPVVETPIRLRQVYADSPGQGVTVFTMGPKGGEATAELELLFQEIVQYGRDTEETR